MERATAVNYRQFILFKNRLISLEADFEPGIKNTKDRVLDGNSSDSDNRQRRRNCIYTSRLHVYYEPWSDAHSSCRSPLARL